ncbi:hypothetical protein CC2G_003375 [Coprinopsis cinerea AmutBmut pab1-1]|nr:hypothetical protein CC2G_003375 [Coprinopsis cinerea AmutBmut pab1-1]
MGPPGTRITRIRSANKAALTGHGSVWTSSIQPRLGVFSESKVVLMMTVSVLLSWTSRTSKHYQNLTGATTD